MFQNNPEKLVAFKTEIQALIKLALVITVKKGMPYEQSYLLTHIWIQTQHEIKDTVHVAFLPHV